MISVAEAKQLLAAQVGALSPVQMPVAEAVDLVLAESVYSPVDIPLFDQSSMDGYALRLGEGTDHSFSLAGEIRAGDSGGFALAAGQAVRIFTGAPVPASADTIVIQEHTIECDGAVHVNGTLKKNAFIRRKGAQTRQGDCVLRKGAVITPAVAGFLASMGIASVQVYRQPSVALVITGNEIVHPGQPLRAGQVYESNSFSIRAALRQFHLRSSCFFARDERQELRARIETALQHTDLLLITGGISVGKYDLVGDVLRTLGAEPIFYKVAQKPGKPLYAGKLGGKLVFALPGNPASVLVCFYEYVYPAIRRMMGYDEDRNAVCRRKLLGPLQNEEERDCFVRAKLEADGVMPLEGQDSYMMQSFAFADAFIFVPRNTRLAAGEEAEVHLVPRSLNCFGS